MTVGRRFRRPNTLALLAACCILLLLTPTLALAGIKQRSKTSDAGAVATPSGEGSSTTPPEVVEANLAQAEEKAEQADAPPPADGDLAELKEELKKDLDKKQEREEILSQELEAAKTEAIDKKTDPTVEKALETIIKDKLKETRDQEEKIEEEIENINDQEAKEEAVAKAESDSQTPSTPPADSSDEKKSPIGDGPGVCPRNCNGHGTCKTVKGKSQCICDAGFEDSDCGVESGGGDSTLPSIWTILLLVLAVIAVERIIWAYKKFCATDSGRNTDGFSQVGLSGDDDHEEFGDQSLNDRL